jgi:D-erythrose 4-phosphate dehydrogenase
LPFRLAINGYGRIGRCILRALYESTNYADLSIVALNDIADPRSIAHLTRYDSTHGRFLGRVEVSGNELEIEGDRIKLFRSSQVADLPWHESEVDLVMECSGSFTDRRTAQQHIEQGAKRVLFSQPAESDVDNTIVYGINHETLSATQTIVSNASCTTNCIVPVLQVLDREYGIQTGAITTIHSAMNDQPIIDSYHDQDLRKTRSAMQSIIPVETALAKGIERILPNLAGKLTAQAIRVPTVNVSAMDISINVESATSTEKVIQAIKAASKSLPANILGYTDEPLASCDFNHDPRSAIVDLNQTKVIDGHFIKMFVWFDNEWAYANRMLDVAQHMCRLQQK